MEQAKKGFRQPPKANKKEIAQENQRLSNQVATIVNQQGKHLQSIGNILFQQSQKFQSLQQQVDTMAAIAASFPTQEPLQKGDNVMMDYIGFVLKDDDTPEMTEFGLPNYFDGGYEALSILTNIGSGKLVPGFEDQLLGKTAGSTFEVVVTFPDNYGEPTLAKRKAKFLVTLRQVFRPVSDSPVQVIERQFREAKAKFVAAQQAEAAKLAEAQKAAAEAANPVSTPSQPVESTGESAPQQG